MEFFIIRNLPTRAAPTRGFQTHIVVIGIGSITLMESDGRAFICKLRPFGRLELQRKSDHVPIKRYGSCSITYENDRVAHSHRPTPFDVRAMRRNDQVHRTGATNATKQVYKGYCSVRFVPPILLVILRRWNTLPELTLLVADGCDATN